jgi:bifunctional UDP-N-acetylglucosamine pyrophosphorylase/glucosamine-1-phosphate N-acetyltransferase
MRRSIAGQGTKAAVVVAAAGFGQLPLAGTSVPKILTPFPFPDGDRTIGEHVIDLAIQVASPVVAVTNPLWGDHLRQRFISCEALHFAVQLGRWGTAKAVEIALQWLDELEERKQIDPIDDLLVLFGDMPLWRPETLQCLLQQHQQGGAVMTLGTVRKVDAPAMVQGYGHLIRDEAGSIADVFEPSEANPMVLVGVTHVSPSLMVLSREWTQKTLPIVPATERRDGYEPEFHLSWLIPIAAYDGGIREVEVDPEEAVGINTLADLKAAQEIWRRRNGR